MASATDACCHGGHDDNTGQTQNISHASQSSSSSEDQLSTMIETLRRCISHSSESKVCRKLVRTCDLFWCTVKAHVHALNNIYIEKEQRCRLKFELINIHVLRDQRYLNSQAVQRSIQEAMIILSSPSEKWNMNGALRSSMYVLDQKTPPSEAEAESKMKRVHELISKLASETEITSSKSLGKVSTEVKTANILTEKTRSSERLPQPFLNELRRFFSVCNLLDQLRKFVVSHYMIVSNAVDTFERLTGVSCKIPYLKILEDEVFYCSPMLAKLHTTMECLAGYITCAHCLGQKGNSSASPRLPSLKIFLGATPNYLCPLCESVLKHPVVLRCQHRFCLCCLESIRPTTDRCPVCSKIMNLQSSTSLKVDSVLQNFIANHFPEEASHPCTMHNCGNTAATKHSEEKTDNCSGSSGNNNTDSYPTHTKTNHCKSEKVQSGCAGSGCAGTSDTQNKKRNGGQRGTEKMPKKRKISAIRSEITGNIRSILEQITSFHIRCCSDELPATHRTVYRSNTAHSQQPTHNRNRIQRIHRNETFKLKEKTVASSSHSRHHHSDVAGTDNPAGRAQHSHGDSKAGGSINLPDGSPLPQIRTPQLRTNFDCLTTPNCNAAHLPDLSLSETQMDDWLSTLDIPDGIHSGDLTTSSFEFGNDIFAQLQLPSSSYIINEEGAPYSKRKESYAPLVVPQEGSCHQCKVKVSMSNLLRCTATSAVSGQKCKKKFCHSCLKRKYSIELDKVDTGKWECPACCGFCSCAVCTRKNKGVKSSTLSAKASCHQCKLKKPQQELRHCEMVIGNRHCRKKFCEQCLTRYVLSLPNDSHFKCPACLGICTCASCVRRREKMNQ
mmetsp:Transcript_47888/g.79349  ORF Transcript_47888/g.79349 Transcript_47888/m.79349 type:complete len:840 (+) Transcript_47888:171-2690(+)